MTKDINVLAQSLALAMEAAGRASQASAEANELVATYRSDLHTAMQDGSYKTFEGAGLTASRRTKKYPQVVDAEAMKAHIVSLELEEDYTVTRYDEAKAKRDAVKNGWPGVEVEERDELVVKQN